jgi:hypothetical protein
MAAPSRSPPVTTTASRRRPHNTAGHRTGITSTSTSRPSSPSSPRTTRNGCEGIWSLMKRSMANFAAADQAGLVRIIKRKLKKIQYRPYLIDGCLAGTGLRIEPW